MFYINNVMTDRLFMAIIFIFNKDLMHISMRRGILDYSFLVLGMWIVSFFVFNLDYLRVSHFIIFRCNINSFSQYRIKVQKVKRSYRMGRGP
jgi:hypothetical protein